MYDKLAVVSDNKHNVMKLKKKKASQIYKGTQAEGEQRQHVKCRFEYTVDVKTLTSHYNNCKGSRALRLYVCFNHGNMYNN